MAKKVKTQIKLQIAGGKATPAPPVGPALGQHGLDIQGFCNKFNDFTKSRAGEVVPTIITVYEDRTFDFICKTPPASELLKKAAGITSAAHKPNTEVAGKVTKAQLRAIAEKKLPDLNTKDVEAAMKIIAGTARQAGIQIID